MRVGLCHGLDPTGEPAALFDGSVSERRERAVHLRPWQASFAGGQDFTVLGHIGINVPDLEVARRYYADLMPRVGFETFLDESDQFAYRPAAGKRGAYIFFYPTRSAEIYHRDITTGLQHLAFMVRSRTGVDDLHEWAEHNGNEVLHRPREFPEYPPPYYATFWLDPFGIMLEAACHHAS